MPHLIDARPLIDAFSQTDPRIPVLVFALLDIYLEDGPFEFDASAIAERLSGQTLEPRLNPETIASLQPDLERFFEPGAEGWAPRVGVLEYAQDAAARPAYPARAPGDIAPS